MTMPDFQEFMLPVLRSAADGEKRNADIADRVADELKLTQEEREQLLPSGRQRVYLNRLQWAKFYLMKAGLVAFPSRGKFVATEEGRAVLAANPPHIDRAFLMRYPAFRKFEVNDDPEAEVAGTPTSSQPSLATTTPEEQIESAVQSLQQALRSELLDRILDNSPAFFEQLIVDLLVAMGYGGSHKNAAMQLGRSGDGGVDGIINEDRLGLDRVYIQAKRYKDNSVGRPDVQAFVGSLVGFGATKGVFVTTSTFSGQARDFVKHLAQRVILIDGNHLAELMIEHGVGVRVSRAVEFKRLDEDFFVED
ncbi:Mrr restriction system protein [Variibacter gotjawalensis]|uniref:Mrr restriction system protein n=1 Tax=Variibacter gotjawalensis TaxID=1333996 RepID=A0A0S3PNP7_9BRAD|nr:restriction endonuclease [Variibacter gotjawalensis]NIK47837.1 restriction system protein [Variibacter gotjawalensis]RZS49724.1 restriction system protein [Variibacter gotjawalensis]BAT57553.1 Mrr restriction system protein [Variibacter gotjawalensis]